jgi:hypothetical protein
MRDHAGRRSAGLGLWWGYLPLVLVALLIAAMVVLVPSDLPDTEAAGGAPTEVADSQTASGWGEAVTPCDDRDLQVEGDGYSPPCFTFAEGADNGGETSQGVTADTIKVTYRQTPDPNLLSTLAQIAGVPIDETPEDLIRTAEGLVDYFNENFEMYGRQMELERVDGRGSLITEFTGGGQEDANNDAIKVATEAEAFADVTGLTQPYADALYRNQVISVGAPYMSREWFTERRPYTWSNFPDCTVASEAATEYGTKRVMGKPAEFAGGDLTGRTRTLGLIAPNNLEYQQCADAAQAVIDDAGFEITFRTDYVLDLAQLQTQASSLLSQLKANDITSVVCGCDPILLMYLAQQAEQQDYQPEWLILGVGFIDLDLVGQMISQQSGDQWTRAFGGSPWAAQVPLAESDAYKAYKSVRDDEPSILIDIIYYQLYQLVIGIQMAGPELTPENFETGMFAYPGGDGGAGRWDFSPEHYTGVTDIRELWWDPDAESPFNGLPGTYADNGERYQQGEIPEGDPEVFG